MKTFEQMYPGKYIIGDEYPPDGDWENGEWNSKKIDTLWLRLYLDSIKNRAWEAAYLIRPICPKAAAHLRNYLKNTGKTLLVDFKDIIKSDEIAQGNFSMGLKKAQAAAEVFANTDSTVSIVEDGYSQVLLENGDWGLAVGTYYSFGHAIVRKGKGRKSCCYYMNWEYLLRDNYEFQDLWGRQGFAGLIFDGELRMLNIYGMAKHFKSRGVVTLRDFVWIKGKRWNYKVAVQFLDGKRIPIPQCK